MSEGEMDMDADEGVAIIGISGRFPMASDVATFWRNIKAGQECITFFDEGELAFKPNLDNTDDRKRFVAAKGILEGFEDFDAKFWGYTPREAELIDPQQRIFLECAWEAMEDAGYDSDRFLGAVGVYGGCYVDTYLLNNLCRRPGFLNEWIQSIQVGSLQTELGNDKDYIATRAAFKLNLRGPAVNVQAACSTSLVAINMAYQSLMSYQSDMALAGGVTLTLPQEKGYLYTEGSMLSQDGHCRAFDADATGTVFSNAGAVILLKRESDAIADRDHIYAVIKGAALNNDGADKLSFTAPSIQGQAEVIATAQAIGNIDPRTIGYIEAHGTATPLGDPIEVAGLTKAFREMTDDNQYCALGSVKTNLGHLDVASGVVGTIKAALMLKEAVLVPSLNFSEPNPKIDFSKTPFYVNTELKHWPEEAWPRRAGVSSFGVGGTNAHIVLQEPNREAREEAVMGPFLFVFSGRSENAVKDYSTRLAQHLAQTDDRLDDISYTLQVGRKAFENRGFVVAHDKAEALQRLNNFQTQGSSFGKTQRADPPVVLMFPGQGAQFPGMAKDLYQHNPVFKQYFDRCREILLQRNQTDLHRIVFDNQDAELLKETSHAQPAIFAIEYALAQVWLSWGLRPQALIGHSVGEYCAACLAGVLSLEDALHLVAKRGEFMQAMAQGSMLSARGELEHILSLLPKGIDLAAHNAPALCVLSGSKADIATCAELLNSKGIPCSELHTSHAFHSHLMDGAVAPTVELLKTITLQPPSIPIMSTVQGRWLTDEEAVSPAYWGRNMRDTVRFTEGIQALAAEDYPVYIEVGPGQTLRTLAAQSLPRGTDALSIASLPHVQSQDGDLETLMTGLGKLWIAGLSLDWDLISTGEPHRVSLPTYPFQRKRHWVDAPSHTDTATTATDTATAAAETRNVQPGKKADSMDHLRSVVRQQIDIMAQQIDMMKK